MSKKLIVFLLAFLLGVVCWETMRQFRRGFLEDDKASVLKSRSETAIAKQTENNAGYDFDLSNSSFSAQTNLVTNIENKPKLSCTDIELLPVWNELKKDRQFRSRKADFYTTADCADMLEVQKIDLNDDRQNEIVVWGNNGNLCGGTGNCDVWIYEKINGKYKQILQSYAFHELKEKWFEVKQVKSNGHRNLLLKGHHTASETIENYYEYNGSRYKQKKCLYISCNYSGGF